MEIQTIFNRVEKQPFFVYGKTSFSEQGGTMVIECEMIARKNSRPICSGCGQQASGYDRLPQRRYQYVPLWQIPVHLVYAPRRVECADCGVRVEAVPWAEGKSHLTHSFIWFLSNWARRMSLKETAAIFGVSWQTVFRAVEGAVSWGRKHMDLSGVTAIGIDEIHWRRGTKLPGLGPRYITLVYQIDNHCRRLLWIGLDRKVETLESFFEWFGQARTDAIEFVCADMWQSYWKVIRKRLPHAVQFLDRFHIAQKLSKAIDQLRAAECRELKAKGNNILVNKRWILLKRPETLHGVQKDSLRALLKLNLRCTRAHLLKESLQRLWTYKSLYWAGCFLDRWCEQVMRSRLDPLKTVARSLRKHRQLILNWLVATDLAKGAVEGFNNKAKVTVRKSYGFRTFHGIEVALYHQLADLPQPEFTHRFW
jgi:transposase